MKELNLKGSRSTTHIIVLRSPRNVAENQAIGHRGFWLDNITGYDNGLREIAISTDRTPKIKAWINVVGSEAEKLHSVPLIWHPDISTEDVCAATNRTVVEIEASTVEELNTKWKKALRISH